MSDKVKMVIGLELENGEKMLLSEETAKELYEKLKKVFEEKNPSYVFMPYPVYVNPQPVIYIQPYNPWPTWYTTWLNTCGSSAGVTSGYNGGTLTIGSGGDSLVGGSVSASFSANL